MAAKKALSPASVRLLRTAPGLPPLERRAPNARRGDRTVAGLDWPATLARKGPRALRAADLVWRAAPLVPSYLHTVVLDASGSMLRRARLARAKAVVLALVQRAARLGQDVALLVVDGRGVHVLQPPALSRRALGVVVRIVGGGGGTPMADALQRAEALALEWALRAKARAQRVLWLLTDGRVRTTAPRPAFEYCVVLDFDDDRPAIGRARLWAWQWQAYHVQAASWVGPRR